MLTWETAPKISWLEERGFSIWIVIPCPFCIKAYNHFPRFLSLEESALHECLEKWKNYSKQIFPLSRCFFPTEKQEFIISDPKKRYQLFRFFEMPSWQVRLWWAKEEAKVPIGSTDNDVFIIKQDRGIYSKLIFKTNGFWAIKAVSDFWQKRPDEYTYDAKRPNTVLYFRFLTSCQQFFDQSPKAK